MPVAAGQLILVVALLAILFSTIAGMFRFRDRSARAITLLVGLSEAVYCLAVSRLLELSEPAAGALWARILLSLATPAVLSAQLFILAVGRADPLGSFKRHRLSILLQGLVGAGFLAFIASPEMVRGFAREEGVYAVELGPVGRLYLIFLLVGIGMIGFRLESTLRGSDRIQRERLRWLALGVFGVVGYFVYLLTEGAANGSLGRDALGASLVPIGLAAALTGWTHVRGGLADAGVTIGRHVVFRSLTGAFVLGYLVLVLLVGQLVQLLGFRPGFIAGAIILFASSTGLAAFLLSRTFRRNLRRQVEKHLYSGRLDYRTWWLRASHELVSGVGVNELVARSSQIFEELFGARPVTIYLARRDGDPYRAMTLSGGEEGPDVDPSEPIARMLDSVGEPIRIPARRDAQADPALLPILVEHETLLAATSGRVAAPLRTAERLIGFVLLGPRGDRADYNYEDLALLDTVTLQLAGAIRGAWLTEDLGAAREMEVFSQWANIVVHDLKNFVSPLRLFVQNARRHLHNPEFREQAIDDIQAVVGKMEREIHRLTALRHGEEMAPAPTDIEWVLDTAVARLGVESRGEYQLQRRSAGLPPVLADATLLDRVFTNLVTNALEAMPDGGVLTLETEDQRDAGNGNRWAVIRVRDTGVGMSPAFLRHRLFQPFATTKKKGWGLGLYQCRSIVEAHGGTLTASSQPGLGTEFRLALPLKVSAVREEARGDRRRPVGRSWRAPE